MIKKKLIIIISICLVHLFLNNAQAVEPDEILKNQQQELRARDISKKNQILYYHLIIILLIQY